MGEEETPLRPAPTHTMYGPTQFAAAFNVSRETLARLELYEALLRQWQKAVNLVAPSTLDAIWHRHFADSAQLLPLAPSARTWLDLGSGGGFPGLVIAILLAGEKAEAAPSPRRVTLVESNARKGAFLREVTRQTGISARLDVDILSTRAESVRPQVNLALPDVITARALAPLDRLLDLAAPLFLPGAVGLFLKGREVEKELAAAKNAWSFKAALIQSRTEREGRVVVIRDLAAKPRD